MKTYLFDNLIDRSLFYEGVAPSLECVLLDREQRVSFQNTLMNRFAAFTLIALKINMPGPIKSNRLTRYLLAQGKARMLEVLARQGVGIVYMKEVRTIASENLFAVVDAKNAHAIKQSTVNIENHDPLGRLFDFDVYQNHHAITRDMLGYDERICLICNKSSKECGRQRTHSVEELHDAMLAIINNEGVNHAKNGEDY